MTLIYHILTDVTYQAYRTLKMNYIFTLILYNYYHHSLDDFRKRRGDNLVSPRERFCHSCPSYEQELGGRASVS